MKTMLIITIVWNALLYLMGGWSLVFGMLVLNAMIITGLRYLLSRSEKADSFTGLTIEHEA